MYDIIESDIMEKLLQPVNQEGTERVNALITSAYNLTDFNIKQKCAIEMSSMITIPNYIIKSLVYNHLTTR